MVAEIISGRYSAYGQNFGVVVGRTDMNSVESMRQVYDLAASTRDTCNNLRKKTCLECPDAENCKLKALIAQVVDNLNELM